MTFVTAGYPRVEDTVPIMLAMQEGGADIIELGVPFSDPMADGPAIQETNTVCHCLSDGLETSHGLHAGRSQQQCRLRKMSRDGCRGSQTWFDSSYPLNGLVR